MRSAAAFATLEIAATGCDKDCSITGSASMALNVRMLLRRLISLGTGGRRQRPLWRSSVWELERRINGLAR
jgi:hypothetical protein